MPSRSRSTAGSVTSPATTSIGRSPAPIRREALRRNHSSAAGSRSTATTRARGRAWATASAMAPVPLQKSTATAADGNGRSRAHATSSSVSGRGTNAPGPTATSMPPNATEPVRCCSGTRCARDATRSSKTASCGSVNASISSRAPRGTPRTWAASSSASVRGEATPASASVRAARTRAGRMDNRSTVTRPVSRRTVGPVECWVSGGRRCCGRRWPRHREVRRRVRPGRPRARDRRARPARHFHERSADRRARG